VEQVWQAFSIKGQCIYILGFVKCMISVAIVQFCGCGAKVARENMQMNESNCVPQNTVTQADLIPDNEAIH